MSAKIIPSPLYRSDYEHDACGVGFIANIEGKKSYDIVDRGVAALKSLAHRGAIDADSVTGDGAGIVTEIPYELLQEYLESQRKRLYRKRDLAVGVVFLPLQDEYVQAYSRRLIEESIRAQGLKFLAWREVPVDPSCLGQKAEQTRPLILQFLFARDEQVTDEEFERRCFLVMKAAERRAADEEVEGFYLVSVSSRTITYKGLLNAPQIRRLFLDLKSSKYRSSFVIFHQRFATNTLPDWHKAQPYRMMAHNGEINTIRGNRNLMRAREFSSEHGVWGDRYHDLRPFIQPEMSDSASFDNALQLITVGGRSCILSAAMMMPSAWEKNDFLPMEVRDFYRYHSTILEPWDGPAAIVFTDGRFVGAALDRNGLRPMRYKIYDDRTIVVASEVGVVPDWGAKVIQNGRLGPGKMIAVDIKDRRFLENDEIKIYLANQDDYNKWCRESLCDLNELSRENNHLGKAAFSDADLVRLQMAFGYYLDERELVLLPMIANGEEPLGCMGDDTPIAILSRRPRLLYTYFKQLFAQVTNPAIDPIRESLVMSLSMYLGGRVGLFEGTVHHREFVEIDSPILFRNEYEKLFEVEFLKGAVWKTDVLFDADKGPEGLEKALKRTSAQVRMAVESEAVRVVVLSDRKVGRGKAAIPMLLAVGAVHQELVRAGLRLKCDILADTGEARDVHQIACLLGFGANAVHPYLAQEMIRSLVESGSGPDRLDVDAALRNYRQALNKGLLKIMSKMGISTLLSYQAAQVFEAVGLSNRLVDECFFGTSTPIGGISYRQIAEETLRRHERAFSDDDDAITLIEEGYYRIKRRGDGEFHGWNPKVVSGMNKFIRGGTAEAYNPFKQASDDHPPVGIKDLLKLRYRGRSLPLEEIESVFEIRRRFTTAAMSLGALSPEAHECLAIAMNSIGGKSNSGEGGEDPRRFSPFPNGKDANSAIKQVASGRFGVTAEYLASAKEIEIKIAQGAKPGEGGQLPGHKVSEMIARLRYSVPGVPLISPPPHHDIYSIEDLAQLIFDLKQVNPRAKVCVKLVSCSGVGTIAAGVAKAYADVILICGHEGGTGASPISSIKNAGSAWEIGIAEAHQTLMMNGLRGRVTLRTDGGFKTGRDIVIASILGAEEFNFGTAALIAAGCAMFRVCHLNSCPVGVATQREDLRAKFRGKVENVVNYFNAVAEDVRMHLSRLGYATLNEIIGRTELLEQIDDPGNPKTRLINLSGLLHNPDPTGDSERTHTRERNDRFGGEGSLDDQILQEAKDVIRGRRRHYRGRYRIRNTNRDVGTHIAGEIAYLHGNTGLETGALDLSFVGTAGQSFGTFLVQGMRLRLFGDANDYVGKGINGGEIVIRPQDHETFVWNENIIMGNTCLYGATGGFLFGAGRAGERFGVRNSGGTAVIEGLGDHGCEYMTRGTVVVLGPTGRNFGAGMSGGLAFVYDADGLFDRCYNPEMVGIDRLELESEIDSLRKLVELHCQFTKSPWARSLLDDWSEAVSTFWKVKPHPTESSQVQPVFDFGLDLQAIAV